MHALAHSTITLILCGDDLEAMSRARELIALADEKGSLYWRANGQMWEGCLAALAGRSSEAVEILLPALHTYRLTGATIYAPYVTSCLARAYAELGDYKAASQAIDQALAEVERTKEEWCLAELHRVTGELALCSPQPDEETAEDHFQRALEVARQQGAKGWELRASISLSRFWQEHGKQIEAMSLLVSVNDCFSRELDVPDLSEMRTLLGDLERKTRQQGP
jgi:predicted ATPase